MPACASWLAGWLLKEEEVKRRRQLITREPTNGISHSEGLAYAPHSLFPPPYCRHRRRRRHRRHRLSPSIRRQGRLR